MILPSPGSPFRPAAESENALPPPDHNAVAARAYQLWVDRGRPQGSDLSNWLEAEVTLTPYYRAQERFRSLLAREDRWRLLVDTVTDFITVIDGDGTILFVNHALSGVRLSAVVGSNVYQLLPAEHHAPFRKAMEHVFRTGQPTSYEVAVALPGLAELRWFSTRMGPFFHDGQVAAATCISTDITDRKRAEQRLATVHAVTGILAHSDSLAEAAPQVVQAICESLRWAMGALWLLDRRADVLRCLDVWHEPTIDVSSFKQATRSRAFSRGVGLPGHIWVSQRPVWIRDVTCEENFPRAAFAAQQGLHAACGFPILDGGTFLGVMEFFSRDIQEPDALLLEMMGSIAGEIAQFSERRRAERHLRQREREITLARQIQVALLPRSMPRLPGFSFGGASRFCQETGGDYYDYIPLADGGLGIALGDASGHGMAAALIMEETRASIRALALSRADPATILTLTNRCLADDLPADHFVTLFLARLDPESRSLIYSNAGHWPGYVFGPDGEVRLELSSTNIPLGMEPTAEFSNSPPILLEPGELLFLLSDGVVETTSEGGSFFGIQRALEIVRRHRRDRAEEIVRALLSAVNEFRGDAVQLDDVTAVVIKVEPPG